MTRTINQIIEAVTNADRLFNTLRDIQPQLTSQGRPITTQKQGFFIVEVLLRNQHKHLLCSTSDETSLRKLYLDYTLRTPFDTSAVTFLENEMILFDSYGRCSMASVLLVDAASVSAILKPDNRKPSNHKWQIEREGVVWCQTAQGVHYTDTNGNPLTPDIFVWGEPLREGRAMVETESGYGLIDKQGNFRLEPHFEELAWNERTGVCVAMIGGRWDMYNRDGEKITEESYEWIGEACGDLYPMIDNGQSGFLGCDGRIAIPAEWDSANSFGNHLTTVTRDGNLHIIDKEGLLIK
jgi:hypothetical protein